MSELLKGDYLKKAFPPTEDPAQVEKEVDDFRENIEQHIQVFKDYFSTRAAAMGLDAEQKEARQEKFLKDMMSYAIDSALPIMKAQGIEDKSVQPEVARQAKAVSEENTEALRKAILSDLGLEDSTALKSSAPVETQGVKTENEMTHVIHKDLPDEIFETLAEMRFELVTGAGVLKKAFIDKYRELYESLI